MDFFSPLWPHHMFCRFMRLRIYYSFAHPHVQASTDLLVCKCSNINSSMCTNIFVCVCVVLRFCKYAATLLAVTRIKAFHFSTLFKGAAAPVFHFTCCRILHSYLLTETATAKATTTPTTMATSQCIKEIC